MWADVALQVMSDEKPMLVGMISTGHPSWQGETFNKFMDMLTRGQMLYKFAMNNRHTQCMLFKTQVFTQLSILLNMGTAFSYSVQVCFLDFV